LVPENQIAVFNYHTNLICERRNKFKTFGHILFELVATIISDQQKRRGFTYLHLKLYCHWVPKESFKILFKMILFLTIFSRAPLYDYPLLISNSRMNEIDRYSEAK
jgi:hypothetical protein